MVSTEAKSKNRLVALVLVNKPGGAREIERLITVCSALGPPISLIEPSLQLNSPEDGNINYLAERIRVVDAQR